MTKVRHKNVGYGQRPNFFLCFQGFLPCFSTQEFRTCLFLTPTPLTPPHPPSIYIYNRGVRWVGGGQGGSKFWIPGLKPTTDWFFTALGGGAYPISGPLLGSNTKKIGFLRVRKTGQKARKTEEKVRPLAVTNIFMPDFRHSHTLQQSDLRFEHPPGSRHRK